MTTPLQSSWPTKSPDAQGAASLAAADHIAISFSGGGLAVAAKGGLNRSH